MFDPPVRGSAVATGDTGETATAGAGVGFAAGGAAVRPGPAGTVGAVVGGAAVVVGAAAVTTIVPVMNVWMLQW